MTRYVVFQIHFCLFVLALPVCDCVCVCVWPLIASQLIAMCASVSLTCGSSLKCQPYLLALPVSLTCCSRWNQMKKQSQDEGGAEEEFSKGLLESVENLRWKVQYWPCSCSTCLQDCCQELDVMKSLRLLKLIIGKLGKAMSFLSLTAWLTSNMGKCFVDCWTNIGRSKQASHAYGSRYALYERQLEGFDHCPTRNVCCYV